ncbi:unnamed protein product [Meganyctiphanes norvegica]|uniref:Peroxidase n=1 Tax=Meganyctiphanes norvegica TaxID=48144 RepID=A0AAV2PY19_MEGNR
MPCCDDGKLVVEPKNGCLPIIIPGNDPFYSDKVECIRFVRSSPAMDIGLNYKEMQQINQNTAFIDASHVYGSNDIVADYVRTKSGGRLKTSDNDDTGKPMPPFGGHLTDAPACPKAIEDGAPKCPITLEKDCFLAGDVRIDMVPGLIVIHTAFIRFHNIIAYQLSSFNTNWDDETIYQETRRIVGALFQLITYRDWLPILLGDKVMNDYNLNVASGGYSKTYNPVVIPTIRNVFATAAFRFGHSLPGDILKAAEKKDDFNQTFHFFDTCIIQKAKTSPSSMLKGLARCPMEPFDTVVGSALRDRLFERPAGPENDPPQPGLDLLSLNLMRGRDHGIPAYPKWREFCGLPPVEKFKQLKKAMGKKIAKKFKKTYNGKIKDIDLFAAGLAEKPLPDGILGPTFSCIIALQFKWLKHGDRFWYESKEQPKPFTPDQLRALRQTSLASILCKVTEGLYKFQKNPFLTTDVPGNDVMDCSNHKFIDLSHWQE